MKTLPNTVSRFQYLNLLIDDLYVTIGLESRYQMIIHFNKLIQDNLQKQSLLGFDPCMSDDDFTSEETQTYTKLATTFGLDRDMQAWAES